MWNNPAQWGPLTNLQDYFSLIPTESTYGFLINAALAIVLSSVLARLYLVYGKTYSDRHLLARTFVILSLTTMLVITVVKSSLALSLGLIGALSIVRFRTPIKEPEDLVYLFYSLAIGLGLGAGRKDFTIIMSLIIFGFIIIRAKLKDKDEALPNLTLIVETGYISNSKKKSQLNRITSAIAPLCTIINISRVEMQENKLEAAINIELKNVSSVNKVIDRLTKIDKGINFRILDNASGKLL
tara:strand:- start:15708 stop:16430 length:723 start_codon:yes stop_codon:yes gene_type:complete